MENKNENNFNSFSQKKSIHLRDQFNFVFAELFKKEENKYEVIKLDYIKRLANGEEKFVKEMLATISEDVPIYLEKLEIAYEEKNLGQIKRIAHKLNSPFGTIGLNSLHVINFFNNSNEKEILSSRGFEALTELKNISNKALIEIKKELNSKLN